MKKLLIALLAVLLCLSLVACGTDPVDTTGDDVETTDGTDAPETTKTPETTEPEVMDSDTLAVGEDDGAGFGPINQ